MTCVEVAKPFLDPEDRQVNYRGKEPTIKGVGIARIDINATLPEVVIFVTPNDINGEGTEATPFSRFYECPQEVFLTAPPSVDEYTFLRWVIDNEERPIGETTQSVVVHTCHTALAVYIVEDCQDFPIVCRGTGSPPGIIRPWVPQQVTLNLNYIAGWISEYWSGNPCCNYTHTAAKNWYKIWDVAERSCILPVRPTQDYCASYSLDRQYCGGAQCCCDPTGGTGGPPLCSEDDRCLAWVPECPNPLPCCGTQYMAYSQADNWCDPPQYPWVIETSGYVWYAVSNTFGFVALRRIRCERQGDQVEIEIRASARIRTGWLRQSTYGCHDCCAPSGQCPGCLPCHHSCACDNVNLSSPKRIPFAEEEFYVFTRTFDVGDIEECQQCQIGLFQMMSPLVFPVEVVLDWPMTGNNFAYQLSIEL